MVSTGLSTRPVFLWIMVPLFCYSQQMYCLEICVVHTVVYHLNFLHIDFHKSTIYSFEVFHEFNDGLLVFHVLFHFSTGYNISYI